METSFRFEIDIDASGKGGLEEYALSQEYHDKVLMEMRNEANRKIGKIPAGFSQTPLAGN